MMKALQIGLGIKVADKLEKEKLEKSSSIKRIKDKVDNCEFHDHDGEKKPTTPSIKTDTIDSPAKESQGSA